jgi:hypothetical protein
MTLNDVIKAVDIILDDAELKEKLSITKFDKQNIKKRRSLPKMLELLFKANRLKLVDGPHTKPTE